MVCNPPVQRALLYSRPPSYLTGDHRHCSTFQCCHYVTNSQYLRNPGNHPAMLLIGGATSDGDGLPLSGKTKPRSIKRPILRW